MLKIAIIVFCVISICAFSIGVMMANRNENGERMVGLTIMIGVIYSIVSSIIFFNLGMFHVEQLALKVGAAKYVIDKENVEFQWVTEINAPEITEQNNESVVVPQENVPQNKKPIPKK